MLQRKIGLFGGVAVIVGSIIGSGIFISPKGVFENVPSVGWSLVIWAACGLVSIIGALCYAELGTYIQDSGGDYTYVYVAFGDLLGFLKAWLECFVMTPCGLAINSILCATYLLQPFFDNCVPPAQAIRLLSASILLLLGFINCASVTIVTRIQKFLMVSKITTLSSIIVTGFYLLISGKSTTDSFDSLFEFQSNTSATDLSKILLAFYAGFWAYGGWNSLNTVTEELINPVRNLPRAVFISLGLCTLIYLLVNVAFFSGISPRELLASNAVAFTFAKKFYGQIAVLMPLLVADSCFGSLNAAVLGGSRIYFAAARNGHLPETLSVVNPVRHTPIPAVVCTIFLSLLYLLMSNNAYVLISYGQCVSWFASGMVIAGLLYLRYKEPPSKFPRPLKINIVLPIIFLGVCAFLVIVPLVQSPLKTGLGIFITLTGLPVYYVAVKPVVKIGLFSGFFDSISLSISKLLLLQMPEKRVVRN